MSDLTASQIVNGVATAIWKSIQPIYVPGPTLQPCEIVASDFD